MIKLLVDNDQDAFDTALTSIVKQGERCMDVNADSLTGSVQCAYSNDSGQACAIGQLVAPSDRGYLTNEPIDQLAYNNKEINIGDLNLVLLTEIQEAHDRCGDGKLAMRTYVKLMSVVANKYNLDTKILNKMQEEVYA